MTEGEYKVGINFNPSTSVVVDDIKRRAADLIDVIALIDGAAGAEQNSEIARLKALAKTAIEEGAMWAVKAATKGSRG